MAAWLLLAGLGIAGLLFVGRKLLTSDSIENNSGFWALMLILSMLATAVGFFQYFNT